MKSLVLPLLLAVAPTLALACGPAVWPPPSEDASLPVVPEPVSVTDPSADAVAAVAPTPATGPMPAIEPAATDETVAISAADAEPDRRCVRETGTRIPARDDDGCTALPGDSYDRDDIDRTGAIDTADAIRKLSPSATIR